MLEFPRPRFDTNDSGPVLINVITPARCQRSQGGARLMRSNAASSGIWVRERFAVLLPKLCAETPAGFRISAQSFGGHRENPLSIQDPTYQSSSDEPRLFAGSVRRLPIF